MSSHTVSIMELPQCSFYPGVSRHIRQPFASLAQTEDSEREVTHLEEELGKFHPDAAPGPAAERTQEVLLACIPANTPT